MPFQSKPSRGNRFFLHASTISIAGKVVIFSGESGSGKTTIRNIACEHGYLCYGDELSMNISGNDATWFLSASGTTINNVISPEFYSENLPIGLLVHVHGHLKEGYRIEPCSPMESVAIGFKSVILPGHHNPSTRVNRFRVFSNFARKVPSVTLDFSLDSSFLPALETYING